jgi:tRNA nucleotidyltransferase/poly(A) polymerase
MNQLTDQPAFTSMRTEEERSRDKGRVITVRLNEEEEKQLKEMMDFLQQPKDSTAYKKMFQIGYLTVIHDEKMKLIVSSILDNRRKNWRTGIQPEQFKSWQM